MACSSCAERARKAAEAANTPAQEPAKVAQVKSAIPIAEASVDPTKKVKIRYYGGGQGNVKTVGCRSCGGSGSNYIHVTTETISFVSDDSPNNLFQQTFTIGHDYYVTEKQAEYLLTLTYISRAHEREHKFKLVN